MDDWLVLNQNSKKPCCVRDSKQSANLYPANHFDSIMNELLQLHIHNLLAPVTYGDMFHAFDGPILVLQVLGGYGEALVC